MDRTIIFSPYYDQPVWTGHSGGTMLGRRVVGPRGLLSELELRAGMTHRETTAFERTLAYYLAIRKAEEEGTHFFSESFRKDELSVAAELLRWRDALVMSGWRADISDSAAGMYKFRDLAAVERHFSCPGAADRWFALLGAPGCMSGSRIEVRVSRESLDRIICDVLDRSGADVTYIDAREGSRLDLKAAVKVIPFRNRVDAYRWVSGRDIKEGTLLVNRDNKAFDDVLRAADRPLVRAEYTDSNPLTIQLFKLGMGLFSPIRDIRTLISYLQIPVNPLPFGKRRIVLRHLLEKGGTGSGWSDFLRDNDVKSIILDRFGSDGTVIEASTLEAYLKELTSWSARYMHQLESEEQSPDIVQQLSALSQMCEAMDMMLHTASVDVIDYERLKKWVDGIYSACSFEAEQAQAGSYDVVPDVKAVVDGPERLIWLDCNAEAHARYPLHFLSPAEIGWLGEHGVHAVSEEDFAKASNIAMKEALGKVGREIILVTSQKAYGKRCDEHLILTEIKAAGVPYETVSDPQMPEGVSLPVTPREEPPQEFMLREGVKVPEREKGESFSSVETMIQRPIDYVLEYIVGLRETDFGQVADIAIIKGNVAHSVIGHCARLFKEGRFSELKEDGLSDLIDRTAREQGQLLYSDRMQYGSFKLKLIKSVKSLFMQVIKHHLRVVDDEVPLEVTLPKTAGGRTIGHFNARIDLLLEDANGDFVVIDLKWSESGRYKEKAKTQRDLQLVLYREALKAAFPDRQVLGCAYYAIPQYRFMTNNAYFEDWEDTDCYVPEAGQQQDVYGQATRSYFLRKSQIERGILEGGEGQPFDERMEYIAESMKQDLYPLDEMYEAPDCKGEAYGNKNFVLKGRTL